MTSLRSAETGSPQPHRAAASRAAMPATPDRQTMRFCRSENRSMRMKSAQKQPQPASCSSEEPHPGSVPVTPERRLARATAKSASNAHLRTTTVRINATDSPRCSSRLRRASGKAAPIEKRKNGKTRSTHVIPGTDGSKRNDGGGTCAWNNHAGSSACHRICPDSTIPTIANPRSKSTA